MVADESKLIELSDLRKLSWHGKSATLTLFYSLLAQVPDD